MKSVAEFEKIYLYRPFVDMRRQINGLSQIVEASMELKPDIDSLFVFTHRRKKILKALYWNGSGFALWMTKLEKQTFKWPKRGDDNFPVTPKELSLLLAGLDIVKHQPHQQLDYSAFS